MIEFTNSYEDDEVFQLDFDTKSNALVVRDSTYQYVKVDIHDFLRALDDHPSPELSEILTTWAINRL